MNEQILLVEPPVCTGKDQVFQSRWYRSPENRAQLAQEAFADPFAGLLVVSMALIVGRVAAGQEVTIMAPLLAAVAFGAAAAIAGWRMGQRVTQIVVRSGAFTVTTALNQWRGESEPQLGGEVRADWFPLSYASVSQFKHGLSLHYHDRIVQLHEADWAEFVDLRWSLTERWPATESFQ
jgi:hypothetical protein